MYTYKELKKKIAESDKANDISGFIGSELYDEIIDDTMVKDIKRKAQSLLNDTEDLDEIDLLKDIIEQCEQHLEFDTVENVEDLFMPNEDYLYDFDEDDNW